MLYHCFASFKQSLL